MNVSNILTVDLEDWFHICGVDHLLPEASWHILESRVDANTSKILDLLARHGVTATFFVLGYIAEQHPELIRCIAAEGHEIATHGYAHTRVYTMTPQEFRQDLRKAVTIITRITNRPIKGYRAPEWSIRDDSLWALDILREEGFEYDASMTPLPIIGNPAYSALPRLLDLPHGRMWEFPPLVAVNPLVNLPIGGGWGLRVFPYRVIRRSIRRLNRMGVPAVIFLHPREFDRTVPRVRLPLALNFVLNARIETTERRLKRLLNDFSFTCVSNVMNETL
jgi:polysaccharide deacetylase family protein (PEP-CTERM system associated)